MYHVVKSCRIWKHAESLTSPNLYSTHAHAYTRHTKHTQKHTQLHARTHTHTHAHTRTHIHIHRNTHTNTHAHMHTHMHMCLMNECVSVCVCVCGFVWVYVCVRVCIFQWASFPVFVCLSVLLLLSPCVCSVNSSVRFGVFYDDIIFGGLYGFWWRHRYLK